MKRSLLLVTVLAAAGCGGGSSHHDTSCDPTRVDACAGGQVCEQVQGGTTACFDPVVLKGKVFDLAAPTSGLDSARVVAFDVNGAPATPVVVSAASPAGEYSLAVPSQQRKADGTPVGASLTLRADRAGYESFPSGLRVALPISTASNVTHVGGQWVVQSSQTDIGLAAIASAPPGAITGTAARPGSGAGVLVVAENTATHVGYTAIPGTDGTFTIFNVPGGDYQVRGFAAGVNYTPLSVTVSTSGSTTTTTPASASLVLATGATTATVSGSISIVSTTFWNKTSVLLVVASTYDAAKERGVAPAGLRVGNVTSNWTIAGVPDGHYRILAGFETDYLVRDPSNIGLTAVADFVVTNGAVFLADGTTPATAFNFAFKVTGAVRMLAPMPDANGACTALTSGTLPTDPTTIPIGACTTTSATPVLSWEKYSATSHYELEVVDDGGAVVWQASVAPPSGVDPTVTYGSNAAPVTTANAATPLVAGRTYQVRVTAFNTGGAPISYTEDLLGVFTYQP